MNETETPENFWSKRKQQLQQVKCSCTEFRVFVCLAFAALKIMCTTVLSIVTCYWFFYYLSKYIIETNLPRNSYGYMSRGDDATLAKLSGLAMLLSVTSLAFTIILAVGLLKKKPRYLHAFLVYGVVVLVLFICIAIFTILMLFPGIMVGLSFVPVSDGLHALIIVVVSYSVYATILLTILSIYNKMVEEIRDEQEFLLTYVKLKIGVV